MGQVSTQESLVELSVPCRPEFLRVVRLLVSGYLSRLDIPFDEVENIKVAVSEACNNAIQFSDKGETKNKLKIRCWNQGSNIVFEIKDSGAGFSMPAEPEGTPDLDDEKGLGFLLIQTLMDDVKIETDDQAGTTVTMTKAWN